MPRLASLKGLASPDCLPASASELRDEITREAVRLIDEGTLAIAKRRSVVPKKRIRWFPVARNREPSVAKPKIEADLSMEALGPRNMHLLLRNFARYRIDFAWRFDGQRNDSANAVRSIFAPVPMEWGLVRKILVDVLNLSQKTERLEATASDSNEPLGDDHCVRPGRTSLVLHRRPIAQSVKEKEYSTGLAYERYIETGDPEPWAKYLKACEELARSEERYERDLARRETQSNL